MDNKNNSQKYDKKVLKEYLSKFSKKQLKEYFDIIAEYSFQRELFMEVNELADLLKELNRAARSKTLAVPSIEDESAEYFFALNPLYFFDYLDKEVIAEILCNYIYYNVIMAENTAETLYHCGRDEAMQYPNLVLSIQKQLGPNFEVLM